jgi:Sulfotransferase family
VRGIVYVAGLGRSGTTLLDQILGPLPGAISVGELRNLPLRFSQKALCSCREPVDECVFWRSVLERSFPRAWQDERTSSIVLRLLRSDTRSGVQTMLAGARLPAPWLEPLWWRVYRQLFDTAGVNTVVDASKSPLYLATLAEAARRSGATLTVVHLVRDPRAVARSAAVAGAERWELPGSYRPYFPAKSIQMSWTLLTPLTEMLAKQLRCQYLRITYEELCDRPRDTILRVADFIGIQAGESIFRDSRTVYIKDGSHHCISGDRRPREARGLIAVDRRTDASALSADVRIGRLGKMVRRRYGYKY